MKEIGEKPIERPRRNEAKSFDFEEPWGKGQWIVLESDNQPLEGALYRAPQPNGELVIFIPGLIGDGVSWMEENHLPRLLAAGYDVYAARHGGIRVNESNVAVVHNATRMQQGGVIGIEHTTVDDWLDEPSTAVEHFSSQPLHVITHSFGGLAFAHSLTDLQRKYGTHESPLHHLRKWISLAGATYNSDAYKRNYETKWRWYFDNVIQKRCNVDATEQELGRMSRAFDRITAELPQVSLPQTTNIISVHPKEDEYVGSDAGTNLQKMLGRGIVFDDRTISKEDGYVGLIHDLPHLSPDVLLRLIKMRGSSLPHTFTLTHKTRKNIDEITQHVDTNS